MSRTALQEGAREHAHGLKLFGKRWELDAILRRTE